MGRRALRTRQEHARLVRGAGWLARVSMVMKRLVVGQPMRSDRVGETLLPKKIALPVF
jgi:hypothetical protein